ncbi:MAG: RNA-binding protein [Nanoarchaeota archaeon]|nr:RNA-binding protein [Nanoarchaeota archaeon]
MKRTQLSKKDIKDINLKLCDSFGRCDFITKKDDVKLLEDGFKVVHVNSESLFFYYENKLVPTLKLILKNNFLKKIVIDMPAVKFIANGADVMRPGIKDVDEGIVNGDIVVIVDENNKKPLAIGISTMSSQELKESTSGKVIKNLHHVGDKIWNI